MLRIVEIGLMVGINVCIYIIMNFNIFGFKEDILICNVGIVIVIMFFLMDILWFMLVVGDFLIVKCLGKYLLAIWERSLYV